MAHVTHFKIKAKSGEREAVLETFRRWGEERGPKVTGFIRSILSSNLDDPDEFMAGVMFDTTENYNANSNDPETSKWFQDLRSHLVADPDWFNGTLEQEVGS